MKKYQVYGIGNALVDYVYNVTPEFLQKNSIDKGVMTLIEEQREQDLRQSFGELQPTRACGGSAANTIIAIAQFGGKSFYSCKVANDETGDFFIKDLEGEKVDHNLATERSEGTTGKCLVLVTPDADRTMNTYLGITASYGPEQLDFESLKQSEYLYMEGYLVASPTGKAAAIEARKFAEANGVKTSLTFSDPNMVQFFKEGIQEMIGDGVDFIFCNEDEGKTFFDTQDLEVVKESLKKIAKSFAITLGAKGSLLWDGEQFIEINGHAVKAIDTVGAGDMFAGAFLYGITNGKSYKESGDLASLASSKVVAKYGPRLTHDETRALID